MNGRTLLLMAVALVATAGLAAQTRHGDDGQTVLHLAASRASYDGSSPDFEWLIAKGADRAIKDNNGKRAFHLVAKSLKAVRQVFN